jgi:hypothetical protein
VRLGYTRPFALRWRYSAALEAAAIGAWADALASAGYRERQGFARAAALGAAFDLSLRLTPGVYLAVGLNGGRVVPRLSLAMAGARVADATWLAAATLSLGWELGS